MKKLLLGVSILAALLITGCTNSETQTIEKTNEIAKEVNITKLSREEVKELLKREDIGILDVRSKEEFESGTIDDRAQLIMVRKGPIMEEDLFWAGKELKKLDKNKTWLVYCSNGIRSDKMAKMMVEKGFTHVYEIDGGLAKYNENKN
jgi:rhodanese-related sulfurtransferase